jgi:hydrogenase-4 component B
MNQFFLSVLVILSGGFLSLVCARQFKFSKLIAVALMAAGCLYGLIDAFIKMMTAAPVSAAIDYLNFFSLAFRIDALSAFFLVTIFLVSILAVLYSFNYMDNPEKKMRTAVHYFFFSLLIISMAMVVTAANIITFMLSWEIMSLSSFFLVIHDHHKEENRKAGFLYFIFSHVGAMFILAAFALIYGHTGSFEFSGLAAVPDNIKVLIFIFAFIGFGSKAGIFPFHVWLPHAHPAAPSHISAVMSGVMIKTGIYGIIKIYLLLDFTTALFGTLVLIVGGISGVLGVVYALGQNDLKRLLAYSSVENIGIVLIGLGIGMLGVSSGNMPMAFLGFTGGFLHILNHSLFKSLLFMGAGMVLHQTGSRAIDAMGGLLKHMKITGAAVIIGSLAICGLPPFNGFVGEFFIYFGGFKGIALEKSVFALSIYAIVSLAVIGGLALACFTKVLGVVFQGEPRSTAAQNAKESGPAMLFSMVCLAIACGLIGIFPKLILQLPLNAVAGLGMNLDSHLLDPIVHTSANISCAASILLTAFILVSLLRWVLYKGKSVYKSGTWGCGFTQPTVKMQYSGSSYASFIMEFFKPVAPLDESHEPIKGRFPAVTSYESRVGDLAERHMEKVAVKPVLYVFDKLRWIQHGDIHLYIGYILLAIVLLLFFI